MSSTEPLQCPTCGWTGHREDAEVTGDAVACPVCGEAIG